MDMRAECTKHVRLEKNLSNSRKNKKRGNKKNVATVDGWSSGIQNEMKCSPIPNMSYSPMFWHQSSIPPHMQPQHNGQRLFTTMSDPSVCGYSTVPVAYTMEPVSMPPIYPLYRPVPRPNYKPFRGRSRMNVIPNQYVASNAKQHANTVNGYSSLQDNRSNYLTPSLHQNGDYTSLPPTANNHVAIDIEELNSEHRRYSDPGLGSNDLPPNTNNEDSDSGESGSSITTIDKNNKFILTLIEQMTALREANSEMFRELHKTKLSLENMKVELVRVKQRASLDYQPGMLSDIISEMREANKILDDTMMTKVNAIVEEKNHQKLVELDEVKAQLAKMTEEKAQVDKRITKLEEDVIDLKMNLNNEDRAIAAFEEETLALRRELQEVGTSRNHADNNGAKLEKLVAILHKTMNGAVNVDKIRDCPDYYTSALRSTIGNSTSSNDDASSHVIAKKQGVDSDDNESISEYEGSLYSENESGINNFGNRGPVTDL